MLYESTFFSVLPLISAMAHYKGAASEGTRAAQLLKKRERAKEELERLKQKIAEVSCDAWCLAICQNTIVVPQNIGPGFYREGCSSVDHQQSQNH